MRKKNIGLFMAILENEFSAGILDGAIKAARDFDVNLITFPMDLIHTEYADPEVNRFRYQYNVLAGFSDAESLDGAIIEYGTIAANLSAEYKKIFLDAFGDMPLVILAEKAEGYSSVTVDNDSGLIEVIEHLIIDHKYKKIAYLSGPRGNSDAEARLKVFKDTMNRNDLLVDEDWIMIGNFSVYIEETVIEFVNKHPDVEAIVCANDAMALGTCSALEKIGKKPGKDIYITGFDNISTGFLNEPAITTVKADPADLSYRAVEILLDSNKGIVEEVMPTHIVKRESCGCKEFELDLKWKENLGISDNWRNIAKYQLEEAETRRGLEYELGNVTRELVFATDSHRAQYEAILKTLKRLQFVNSGLFLYDEFISHTDDEIWEFPEELNLVGYYSGLGDSPNYTFDIGEKRIKTTTIFDNFLAQDGKRHEVIVIPLFFVKEHIGLIVVEADPKRFMFAYSMAGQLSNTLYIIAMNEEQKRMKVELEAANKSKSRFLANMSHEIRTPINAIVGFNEMILRENHDDSIEEYALDVKNAADTLLLLVNDILDFSKIEAGKMELINDEYSIDYLLHTIIMMMTDKANKKGLSIFLDFDNNLPSKLLGDYGRIQQILINLMSNAIKYTNEGTVTISVKGTINGDFADIRFTVKDTGIGIRQKDINRLFNEFERIEEKRNRNIEGTGLGINIIIGLLRLMDSDLEVKSEYGKGSEFSFSIKQKIIDATPVGDKKIATQVQEKSTAHSTMFEAPDARIMVVDDNFLNRKVICSLLRDTHMFIEQAESGYKCIELVKENDYDLILLDHMMPDMDGIETLETMLNDKIIDINETPVVALTANAIAGAREEYLECGFADYLAKPVLPKDLYAMLMKYIPEEKIKYIQ